MTEHHAQPVPRQLSLFPDGHELQAQALAALSDLDVSRARRWLDRLRGHSRGLPNVQIIDAAVALLESALPSGRSAEGLARALLMAHATWHEGRLSRAVAEFVDQTIARFWAKGLRGAAFLDAEQRVHRGVLDLVLGDVIAADRHLRRSLEGEFAHRADLWGYLGDAALARGRADQANACYVRALVLSPADVDLLRIRMPALRQLHEELRAGEFAPVAGELLLAHAWLQRALDVPPHNAWLDGHLAQLEAKTAVDAASPPAARLRRFAFLLYLDRSLPTPVDIQRREQMAALVPDLFARFIEVCAQRERAGYGEKASFSSPVPRDV